ncbi:uncharacterized protein LOC129578193 [Sitodiplosis mosellana]|uniref:uncharacterized protein LOC129578193 n=1 Tax=Sitodiplosis mosellana TaxID=263140 RepID=UPI00244515FB|nr:uncharacterized protein LOC129578193 [Sitodiplosis mosellana]
MTIIFERRQVNDKVLVVQFQFDTHDIKSNGRQVDGISLDKYVGLDVWTQIYAKLEEPLERYRSGIDTRLKEEIITMRRAQLELKVSWRSKQPYHREIVNLELKKADLCPYVMVVKIVMVSALDKYKKQHSQEKLTTEKPATKSKSTVRSSDESNGERKSNDSSSAVDVEEYVPAGSVANSFKYTPSTVSSSNEKSDKSNEYSPTHGADDIVTYTPTKIGEIKSHKDQNTKHKLNMKTDVNRNDFVSKKKRSDAPKINDLFGGDSDDSNSRLNKNLRSAKKTIQTDSSKEKHQPKIEDWVTTRHSKKTPNPIENGAPDDVQKKRKIENVNANGTTAKDEEAKKLRALREEFEQMDKPVTIDNIINIKDMSKVELMETFLDHETALRKKFRNYAKVPDHTINPCHDECDYLLILDALVEPEQQIEMYQKLRQTFCQSDPLDAITSKHENLIWKCLLPEWALQVFMDKHFLTQDEAMERLRQQDQFKIQGDASGFDIEY